MNNNDIIRRVRYTFNFNDQKSDGVSVDNNQTQVSIENLNAGLYFILIESKSSKSYKRLIKQ